MIFSDTKPSFLAKLGYYMVPVRRKTALNNMQLVFGDRSDSAQRKRLAQRFYGHLGRCIWENLTVGFLTDRRLHDSVQMVGQDIVFKAADRGKGVILLTGHFGNWEYASVAVGMHFPQFHGRFHVLRRRLVNKLIERVMFKRFYEAGLTVIPKKNSLNRVLEVLANNDVVTFIMDQHAKPGKDGVVVDFFGRPAGTFKSLAMIARATGAPVVPMMCYREKPGKHVMRFYEPIPWIERDDPDAEILDNTRAYNAMLERMVLEHPEQWWWVHKRWKVK